MNFSFGTIYLGSGTRYPDIVDHHNKQAAIFGRQGRLLPINDPNLIYVGQTIMIPLRSKDPSPGPGKKLEASTIATELSFKVDYNFEDGTNPIKYKPYVTRDYTILTEMTGKITIENLTVGSGRQSFEISTALDKNEMTSKIQFNDRALTQLTESVEPQFDMATRQLKLKASIAAHANIGPYEFNVEFDAPNHLTATYKPKPISAVVQNGKQRYKFSAEIAFKVDVTLHPSPKDGPEPIAQQKPVEIKSFLTILGLIAASVLITIYGPKIPLPKSGPGAPIPELSPASNLPFMHTIAPYNAKVGA